MSSPPTGTVTFLFTDIEGSTDLAQTHPAGWDAAAARHHAILRSAVEKYNGYVFQIIGDAFCVAFPTASDGLQGSLAAQRLLQSEAWGEIPIRVRMGLHTGAAAYRDGDYQGYLTLAQVQRVMSVAHGGQTLISNSTAALLSGQLPSGVTPRDLGEHRLKGLTNPERLWQVVAPDLPADFPPLASLNSISNNLPLQLTSFVGRTSELARIRQLLVASEDASLSNPGLSRLVTLVGPGGTGKTRLSLQVAANLLDPSAGSGQAFKDGIWFVELAPLADPALVPATIAAVLDVRLEANRPALAGLADALRFKQLLLIFDNCEHLLDAVAKAADALLHACPRLQLLASSREALGIAGETAFRVPSLACPDPHAEAATATEPGAAANQLASLLQYDAVRLFIDRATAARADFQVTNANAPAVAQICFRLDGIPLAIELAAARIKALRVEQISARLDDRFRLLTGGSRTALPRQQTLRALIDWSYDLLSEPERVLLARLSVFSGGWTLEAAEEVARDEGGRMKDEGRHLQPVPAGTPLDEGHAHPSSLILHPSDILDLLAHLVDKSLVVMDDIAAGSDIETRYHFLETIRQFARDKLLESGDGERVRTRHLRNFDALAATAEPALRSAAAAAWQTRLYADQDNLRTAMEWALAVDPEAALRTSGHLMFFWSDRGRMTEGLSWLQQSLTRVVMLPSAEGGAARERMRLRARGLSAVAHLTVMLGDNRAARAAADESIGLFQSLTDNVGLGFVLCNRGISNIFLGAPQEGIANMRQGIALLRESGDMYSVSAVLPILAQFVVRIENDAAAARAYLEEALRYQRSLGDTARLPITLLNLSVVLRSQKEYERSRAVAEESLQLCLSQNNRRYANVVRSNLAELARLQEHYAEAEDQYRTVIAGWHDLGLHGGFARCLEVMALIAVSQTRYERAARLLAAASAIRAHYHSDMAPDERAETDQALQVIRAQLATGVFEEAWAQGSALDEEGALALACKSF